MEFIEMQKFFNKEITKNYEFRMRVLKNLYVEITTRQSEIALALQQDLGKHEVESYMTEIGIVLSEIRHCRKNLHTWVKSKKIVQTAATFPSVTTVYKQPYGVVLVMSPWNYPFQLAMLPMIGAIAAGNCVVVKTSEYAPATSKVVKAIVETVFHQRHVCVLEGDVEVSRKALENKFDYVFFTGSSAVGKDVMKAAAKNLTPVTLELGGKSPCIVDETANLRQAAKRIIFGKIINAGQTCVAPDYVLAHHKVYENLLELLAQEVYAALGKNPCSNPAYGKIISKRHLHRLLTLLEEQKIYSGGEYSSDLRLEPTIVDSPNPNSPLMQEEIFGPILPVIPYTTWEEAIQFIQNRENPLALYLFSNNKEAQTKVIKSCSFGGGCINDTVSHLISAKAPFGGVGESGMGQYHGKYTFDTFTHEKTVLKSIGTVEMPLRYQPYTKMKTWVIKRVLR